MLSTSQIVRSRAGPGAVRRVYGVTMHVPPGARRLWTSAARIETKAEARKFVESPAVQKYKNVLVPDFGSMNMLDSRQLFETLREFISVRNMKLIVASSNNAKSIDYDQVGGLIEEATKAGMPGTLVVKGSGKHALVDSDLVRQQYADTIRMVKRAGGKLVLPIRLDLDRDTVLRDIARKLAWGADGFASHPISGTASIGPDVRKTLKAILTEYPDFSMQFGALWLTDELYHRIESKQGQLVTKRGLDQYPLRPKPEDGDWESWNVQNMTDLKKLIKEIAPRQRISDSYYSRDGQGHPGSSLMKIASVIESELSPVKIPE